ncbi:MAG: hypothetical protein JWN57_1555 [Frankiales bacterium]|jgi:hypothetical protein|nr:hypothetical protein [Frankiales bacterium]
MVKRLVAVASLAFAIAGIAAAPAHAASVCLTTDVTVNGTASPLNGTNCLPA